MARGQTNALIFGTTRSAVKRVSTCIFSVPSHAPAQSGSATPVPASPSVTAPTPPAPLRLVRLLADTDVMFLALISTFISSIALLGVAVSLLLQSRQLRTSQLEASRAAQSALIQMGLANPKLTAEVFGSSDRDWLAKAGLVNWQVKFWEMSYLTKAMSAKSVHVQAAELFASEFPRDWWSRSRELYKVDATTRREREFFTIIDSEFERKQRRVEASPSS